MTYRSDLSSERVRHRRYDDLDAAVSAQKWLVALLGVSALVLLLLVSSWRANRLEVPLCASDDVPCLCAQSACIVEELAP